MFNWLRMYWERLFEEPNYNIRTDRPNDLYITRHDIEQLGDPGKHLRK